MQMDDKRKVSENSSRQNPAETISNLRTKVKVLQQGVRLEREKLSIEAAKSASLEETKALTNKRRARKSCSIKRYSFLKTIELIRDAKKEKEISRLKVSIQKLEKNIQLLKSGNQFEKLSQPNHGVCLIDSQVKTTDQGSSSEQRDDESKGVFMTHESRMELKKTLIEEARIN